MNNNYSPQMLPVNPAPGSAPAGPISSSAIPPTPVVPVKARSGDSSLLKTVIIILLSLLLIGAILLAYYFYSEYRALSSKFDSEVEAAVIDANKLLENELQAKFDEQEKNPYDTFTGPSDYGSLSFKYPKTWSVYIERDASNGGEFRAYLHPKEIYPIDDDHKNALEVSIDTDTYENATGAFSDLVKDGDLTTSVIKINGEDATRYDGKFSDDITGSLVIIKIRDKIAIIRTDAEIYRDDFNKILETITFNQ